MSLFRKKSPVKDWDRENTEPAILKSICTGEETFGFIRKSDGHFTGLETVRTAGEKEALLASYGLKSGDVKTIW